MRGKMGNALYNFFLVLSAVFVLSIGSGCAGTDVKEPVQSVEFFPWIDIDLSTSEAGLFVQISGDRTYSAITIHFIEGVRGRGVFCILTRHEGVREGYLSESLGFDTERFQAYSEDIVIHLVPMQFDYVTEQINFTAAVGFEDQYGRVWDLRITESYPLTLTEQVETTVSIFDISPDRPLHLPVIFADVLGIISSRRAETFLRIGGDRAVMKRVPSVRDKPGFVGSLADIRPIFLGWNATDRAIRPLLLEKGQERFTFEGSVYDLFWEGEIPAVRRVFLSAANETIVLSFFPPLPGIEYLPLKEDTPLGGDFSLIGTAGSSLNGRYYAGTDDDGVPTIVLSSRMDPVPEDSAFPEVEAFSYIGRFYPDEAGFYRESRWRTYE